MGSLKSGSNFKEMMWKDEYTLEHKDKESSDGLLNDCISFQKEEEEKDGGE